MGVLNVNGYSNPLYFAGKNLIVNGNFDYWFRGTSFSGQQYCADHWYTFANDTVTRQAFSSTPEILGAQYYLRKVPVQTGAYHTVMQIIENGGNDLSGKTVTLSFWARRNTASDYTMEVFSGLANDSQFVNTNISLTGTWTKYIITWNIPVTTGLNPHRYIRWNAAADGRGFDLAQVQLEVGSFATPFTRAGVDLGSELKMCQRYYYHAKSWASYGVIATGKAFSTGIINFQIPLPVNMYAAPSLFMASAMSSFQLETGATAVNTPTSIGINSGINNQQVAAVDATKAGSFTAGAYYFLMGNNNADAYLGFQAELA
jgi:hypothetical protein